MLPDHVHPQLGLHTMTNYPLPEGRGANPTQPGFLVFRENITISQQAQHPGDEKNQG